MHLRRRDVRVMMVMAVMEMRLHPFTDYELPQSRSTDLRESRNGIFDALDHNFTSAEFHIEALPLRS
jgi:hypothetical protein